MAKKNTKPVNKKVSKQTTESIGFVEYKPRNVEIAERIAERNKALADYEKKTKAKKKK